MKKKKASRFLALPSGAAVDISAVLAYSKASDSGRTFYFAGAAMHLEATDAEALCVALEGASDDEASE